MTFCEGRRLTTSTAYVKLYCCDRARGLALTGNHRRDGGAVCGRRYLVPYRYRGGAAQIGVPRLALHARVNAKRK